MRAFRPSGRFDISPSKAASKSGDTLLFHGCSQMSATNIQATGLSISFAAQGMLGKGLYGAPDPRKSLQYCNRGMQASQHGNFMFICRFNLTQAQFAGPNTHHRNTQYEEYCVMQDAQVVVLWMLKLA